MLVLNFSHPLTNQQQLQIEELAHASIAEVRTIPVQLNQEQPLEPQMLALIEQAKLTAKDWQTLPILINPPGYAPAAFVLLAILHSLMGHFPTFIRFRPKHDPITTFAVAELINLQNVRERARQQRQ